jgi:sec-independent protein translocase protein TatA
MSMANLGSHWWVILIIVVLLFGAPKLPALARSMGQSMRIFKNEIKTNKDDDGTEATKAESTEKSGSDTPTTKP